MKVRGKEYPGRYVFFSSQSHATNEWKQEENILCSPLSVSKTELKQ